MIKTLVRKYRLQKEDTEKRAVFITFTEPILRSHLSSCERSLLGLIRKDFNAYIFSFNDPGLINAQVIKLLLRFNNSCGRRSGLLAINGAREVIAISGLSEIFATGENERSILHALART